MQRKPKSGGVVIRSLPTENVEFILGGTEIDTRPLPPFDDRVCAFLNALSSHLMADAAAKAFPDIMTFAFWCRKGHIQQLKSEFGTGPARLGRGLALHIAPSNVPVNFAFSFAFGLLSGNANVVRIASNETAQAKIICGAIASILDNPAYQDIKAMTAMISYPVDNAITGQFSEAADARIIWGGDQTIKSIRRLNAPPRCVDLAFADRTSLCVMDINSVEAADDKTLNRLAQDFFNDTYLMDQNACSSPHLIVWHGKDCEAARQKFWGALKSIVQTMYSLEAVQAVDKYTAALQVAIDMDEADSITRHDIDIIRVNLSELPKKLENTRGQFGLFFEHATNDLGPLADAISPKFQTMTYFGMEKGALSSFVVDGRLRGIDRIVPVGRALAIDVMWDGYDVVKHLSRVVAVE